MTDPDYPVDLLDKGAQVLADRLHTNREELGTFWQELRDDAAAVLDAVDYGHMTRKVGIFKRISEHSINVQAGLVATVRSLRAQTARDAATIKKLQDLSVARLASHDLVVETLRVEIDALRGQPTEAELADAAEADGFDPDCSICVEDGRREANPYVIHVGDLPIPMVEFDAWLDEATR